MSHIFSLKPKPSVQTWVEASRKGDERAMRTLFDLLAPRMLGIARRYLHRIDLAQEAVSTAFARAFDRLKELREDGQFESWTRSIVIRECLDTLRRERRYLIQETEEVIPEGQDDPLPDTRMAVADLLGVIDNLPTGYRTVFNLFAIEGFGHREIAGMLGISENTSKTQYLKARAAIREQLEARAEKESQYGSC